MRVTKFFPVFFFATIFSYQASAQVVIDTNNVVTPNIIVPCQAAEPYKLAIPNNSTDTLFGVYVKYAFPQYLEYVAGSVDGAVEMDAFDIGAPEFLIDTIPPGGTEVCFLGRAACEAAAGEELVFDQISIGYSGNSLTFTGPQYNVKKPVLVFTEVSPIGYSGVPNTVFDQTICLKNEGIGAISELIIQYSALADHASISNTSAGQILPPSGNDFTVIRLDGQDFLSYGNGNNLLENDESVCIELTIALLACGTTPVTITSGWSCSGDICEEISVNGSIAISSLSPLMATGVSELQYATECQSGSLTLFITNNQDEGQFPGSGGLNNLLVKTGFGFNACVALSNFHIEGNPITDSLISDGNILDFNNLSFDPDGPGGLSDLNGDGHFTDLAVGDTVFIKMDLAFDPACVSECSSYFSNYLRVGMEFGNQCGTVGSYSRHFFGAVEYRFTASASEQLQVEYNADTTLEAVFNLYFNSYGGLDCPYASFRLIFDLPQELALPSDFAPTLNEQPVTWSLSGTMLTLTTSTLTSSNVLNMQFLTGCQELEIDPDAPCPIIGGDPESHSIEYRIEMDCDPDCSSQPLTVLCKEAGPFIIACPFPAVGSGGVQIDGFSVSRITLGFTDETLAQQVPPNMPGLALQRAMPHDTVLLACSTVVYGPAEDLELNISYFAVEEWLQFLRGELVFHDAETGTSVTCNNLTPLVIAVNGFQKMTFPISPLFASGACLEQWSLTDGDFFTTNVFVEVTQEVPTTLTDIPGLNAGYSFSWEDLTLSCSNRPAVLEVIRPYAWSSVSYLLPPVGCDTITVVHKLTQNLSGIGDVDIFPGEYRPFAQRDSLNFLLPDEDWIVVSGTAKVIYEGRLDNADYGPVVTDTVPVPDPVEVIVNGEAWLQFSGPFPGVDMIKSSTRDEFSFQMIPSCLTATDPFMPQRFHYKEYAYVPANAVPRLTSRNWVNGYRVGNRTLTPLSPFPQEQDGLASWKFDLKYPGSFGLGVPGVFFQVVLPEGVTAQQLKEIVDLNTVVNHDLLPYGMDNDVWVKIDTLMPASTRSFELTVLGAICEPDTLFVRSNFQCGGYPTDPDSLSANCTASPLEMPLLLNPKKAAFSVILSTLPTGETPLCEELIYEMKGINLGSGKADSLIAFIQLPDGGGLNITPGTSEFRLENGLWMQIGDPQLFVGTNTLRWAALPLPPEGLPSLSDSPNNVFYLRFSLKSTCDYDNGSQFIIGTDWRNSCGSWGVSKFAAPPLNLQGAPTNLNNYVTSIEMAEDHSGFLACDSQNEVIISLLNLPANQVTQMDEYIILELPPGLEYFLNTTEGILNAALLEEPGISWQGNQQVLEWPLPTGVSPGEWITFSISMATIWPDSLPCNEVEFLLRVSKRTGIPCSEAPQSFCSLDFSETSQSILMPVIRPVYGLQNAGASSVMDGTDGETVSFSGTIMNMTSAAGPETLVIAIYQDANQNDTFEKDQDILLGNVPVDATDLQAGSTASFNFTLNIPGSATCDGYLLVIDPENNPCTCQQTYIFVPPPPLDVFPVDTINTCFGQSITLFEGMQNPAYSYSWSSPNVSDPVSANPTYQLPDLSPGTSFEETITLTITRVPDGCTNTDQVTVITTHINAMVSVLSDYNGYPISCNGNVDAIITATGHGGTNSFSYLWSNGEMTDTIRNLSPGLYEVTVTDESGCTTTSSITITEPQQMEVIIQTSDFNGLGVSCYGGEDGFISLQINGGVPFPDNNYSIQWENGAITSDLSDLSAGVYDATLTDANGCSVELSVTLEEPPAITMVVDVANSNCVDRGILSAEVNGGVQPYQVSLNGAISNEMIWTDLPEGSYLIAVTDNNGCSIDTTVSIEEEWSSFTYSVTQATCHGTTDGSICIEPTEVFGGGFLIEWSDGQSGTCASDLVAGNYSVTVTDGNDCPYIFEMLVEQPPELNAIFTVTDNSCFGEYEGAINTTAEGGTPPYLFYWNDGATTPYRSGLAADTYMLTITDEKGCISENAVVISESAPLSVHVEITTVTCPEDADGSAEVTASGGNDPYQYVWNTGSIERSIDSLPAGAYSVTVTDSEGCFMIANTFLAEPPVLIPELSVIAPPCPGEHDGDLFILDPQGPGYQYNFDGSPFQEEPHFGELPPGEFLLSILDSNNCISHAWVDIPQPPEPSIEIIFPNNGNNDLYKINWGDSILLKLEADTSIIHVIWTGGAVPCDTCWENLVMPLQETKYEVLATNENGCTETAGVTIYVSIEDRCPGLPNAFSPNGDGINDQFTIYAKSGTVKRIQTFMVFERWGGNVFEQSNFQPNDPEYGWDGTFRGKPAQQGVYVWLAKVEFLDGSVELFEGDVTLLR